MQPIIQRTITITITETWTITWEDGHETVWHETREVALPAAKKRGRPLPTHTGGDDQEGGVIERDVADQKAEEL